MNWLECLPDRLAQMSATSPWALLLTKATLLLAVAWLVHFSLAWANPRWRTLLWRGVVVGLALLAVWALGLPGLVIHVETPGPVAAVPVPSLPPMVAEHEPAAFPLASARPTESPASVEMTAPAAETSAEVRPEAAQAVEPSEPPLSWCTALLGIWSFGVALLVVRMAIAYCKLAGLLQTSQPASDEIVAEARRIAAVIGCRRLVEVRSSRHYAVPFLYGLWRPTLVLPERMCQPACRAQLPGVLAHELAHVSSRDFGWNAALQAMSILLWFHPLVWRVGSAHRAACDAVCDAVSATHLGDVQAYCRVLARVALEGAASFPATGLAMARTCDVRRRIAVLQQKVFAATLGRRAVVGAVLVGLLSVILLAGVQLTRAESSDQTAKEKPMASSPEKLVPGTASDVPASLLEGQVVDDGGKPIAGAHP